jgi:hypothetical protein
MILLFQSRKSRSLRDYNTTAEIFPDMAHDMMLELNWQDVPDWILGWLTERGL